MTTPRHRRVPHDVDVPADLDSVWRMLTTSEGLAAWYGAAARTDGGQVGARVEVSWGEVLMEGRVDASDAPHRLVISYVDHAGHPTGGEEWLLEHAGGVTHVRVIHSVPDPGVDDWDGYYGDYRRGWRLFLTSLRFALATAAVPHRTADVRFVPVASRQEAWDRVVAALALPTKPATGDRVDAPVLPGARVLLADPPHTVLLADARHSIAADTEGADDDLVLFVQAATHGVAGAQAADFRTRALGLFG